MMRPVIFPDLANRHFRLLRFLPDRDQLVTLGIRKQEIIFANAFLLQPQGFSLGIGRFLGREVKPPAWFAGFVPVNAMDTLSANQPAAYFDFQLRLAFSTGSQRSFGGTLRSQFSITLAET
jgi:hypothetical protein